MDMVNEYQTPCKISVVKVTNSNKSFLWVMIDTLPILTTHVTDDRVTGVLEILDATHLTKVISFPLCVNSHCVMIFHCRSAAKKACLQSKNELETGITVTKEHF